ncbi:hypothetical protein MTR_2g047905 [Medicago truncatula]|uniref:Uncharacterized protein n=1 Tax=Medicago truncatula TaxID=3880 RepID=A0A072V7L5_MEDTR|nr:hypothetical protein MTR_2g047905 [Medicago truncatula]
MIVVTLLRVNKQNDPNDDDEASLDFDGILSQKKQVDDPNDDMSRTQGDVQLKKEGEKKKAKSTVT